MNKIYFYKTRDAHGYLSNFWKKDPFTFEGHTVCHSEALYQALKVNKVNPTLAVRILTEPNPSIAATLGRDPNNGMREDWDDVKDDAMRIALMAKFTEGTSFYEKFLATAGNELIENSPIDSYWGCGSDGQGKNILGVLLMEYRDFINKSLKKHGYDGTGLELQARYKNLIKPFAGEDGRMFAPNFTKPFRGYF